jgi:DNA (cytosine-5)-methyltransferase 1
MRNSTPQRRNRNAAEARKPLTFGSLFAGIGGFDLGFERAGMQCKWQVEIDPYCQRVLTKHWPNIPKWDDVRTFPPAGDWGVDVICGGFPCQDISKAGNVQGERMGIDGNRSGLWSEFERIIRVVQPRFVVVENTTKLLDRGLGRVLGGLAACGHDAEWQCLPSAAFGAGHIRDRLFVLSYTHGERIRMRGRAAFARPPRRPEGEARERDGLRLDIRSMAKSGAAQRQIIHERLMRPDAVRTGNAFPGGVDRRRAIGNSVDPQVAQWIGERIMEAANA